MNEALQKIELYYGQQHLETQPEQDEQGFERTTSFSAVSSPLFRQCEENFIRESRTAVQVLLEQYNSILNWERQSSIGGDVGCDGETWYYQDDVEDDVSEPCMVTQAESMKKVQDFLLAQHQQEQIMDSNRHLRGYLRPNSVPTLSPAVVIIETEDEDNLVDESLRLYEELDD